MDRIIGQKMKRGYEMADGDTDAEDDSDATSETRGFECVAGTSNKFWETTVSGNTHAFCCRRIGTNGTNEEKSFKDNEAVQKAADKLIRQNVGKGYDEV